MRVRSDMGVNVLGVGGKCFGEKCTMGGEEVIQGGKIQGGM